MYILGECKAFVGERNKRKRQGRLRLRIAQGCMCTGWLVNDIHTIELAFEFTSTDSLHLPNQCFTLPTNM